MEEVTDISYYLGDQAIESIGVLDVPLSSGQIVSINVAEELPEDPMELVSFLEGESCAKKYWISVATAYAQRKKLDESKTIIHSAMKARQFADEDRIAFQIFLIWLDLMYAASVPATERANYLDQVSHAIKKVTSAKVANAYSNSAIVLAQGVWCMYMEKNEEALDIFDRILKRDHSNCFALMAKAKIVLKKLMNYAVALKLLQQVLLLNPLMKPDPRIGIGLCYYFLKDRPIAIQAWERALELDHTNTRALILLGLAKFNSAFTESLTNEEFMASYKACLAEFAKFYKAHPKDVAVIMTIASYYFSKNRLDLVEKLVGKALTSLTGSSEWNSKMKAFGKRSKYVVNSLSECATFLGRVAFHRSDYTQASKYFQEAIKLNDKNLMAKLGLGQAQFCRGSIEEATITFELILRGDIKCLEVNYSLGILYAQQKSKRKQEQAIQVLERYIKLSNNQGFASTPAQDGLAFLSKEPIVLNAYLTLSKLYELKDMSQSLTYLIKAIESREQVGETTPLEVYNNIGVLQFLKQNYDDAIVNFDAALKICQSKEGFEQANIDNVDELATDLRISISFNLARAKEITLRPEAIEAYDQLLKECPQYFSAKLRLLFLDSISNTRLTKQEIKDEIETLLETHVSNLEVRSFYGWFVKNFGKKLGLKPDADTTHQKDTLVKYDSHDSYALISLANIYCIMARDVKGPDQEEKKRKYYVRAVELFAKVLSLDPKNVYAAQGLAIAFIENKELLKGLDILRKIRDSLNDISIFLNLGHVCVDLKEYSKAIENYNLALTRFTDEHDSRILSFLGRAWYLRALHEKVIEYYKNATQYARKALEFATGSHALLKFNLAYLHFQTAEFITKLPLAQRSIDDIEESLLDLKEGVKILTDLALDKELHAPYPQKDLLARAHLGETTLLKRLTQCLDDTKEHNESIAMKLLDAQKLRGQEEAEKAKLEQDELARKSKIEEDLALERAKLHEQAQIWAEEARMSVVKEEDGNILEDDELFEEDGVDKKRKRAGPIKKKGKKKQWDDLDDEQDVPVEKKKPAAKKARTKKRRIVSDEEDEGDLMEAAANDAQDNIAKSARKSKRSSAVLSKEYVDDSDDDDMEGESKSEKADSGEDN